MNCLLRIISWASLVHSSTTTINSQLSSPISAGVVGFNAVAFNGMPKQRGRAPDSDNGPYCVIDPTSNKLQTSNFVSSGFLVSSQDCRTNCDLAGCTLYRRDSLSGTTYSKLSQCAVAESFHYSVAGSRQETWCDKFDLRRSVFSYKGQTYIDQWYWLGWGSMNDCMNAILCGPSSHYFDASQAQTLAWCQPVPLGKFSPPCVNSIGECTVPPWADDMKLAVWTSHGFGAADGCGLRLVTSAIVRDTDIGALSGPVWTISAEIGFKSPFQVGSETMLFGIFLTFALSVVFLAPTVVRIKFFHRDFTVSASAATVSSADIQWFPGEARKISVCLSPNSNIQFYIDERFVSESPIVGSVFRASIGRFMIPSFVDILSSSVVHIGPVFAEVADFESASSSGINPYANWGMGSDLAVGNIAFQRSVMTTTTTQRPTETTLFIPPTVITSSSLGTLYSSSSSFPKDAPTTEPTSSTSPLTSSESSLVISSTLTFSDPVMLNFVPESDSAVWWIGGVLLLVATGVLCIFGNREWRSWRKRRRRRYSNDSWIQNITSMPEAWSHPDYSVTI